MYCAAQANSMSNGGWRVWVGDLDGYINIAAIDEANKSEAEERELERELDEIGDIVLFAGKATTAKKLNEKGVSPSEWRHAVHQARTAIGPQLEVALGTNPSGQDNAEGRFFKATLDLGRSYAIARYAHWEHLDYPSAITATLPLGIRALVNQFMAAEGISRSAEIDDRIRSALSAGGIGSMSAYRHTGMLQATLHKIADDAPGHQGAQALNRVRTRVILSLVRLYFSDRELRLSSKQELSRLISTYEVDRNVLGLSKDRITSNGKTINGWRLRHLHSLLHFYPYSIRQSVSRALSSSELTQAAAVNELALAHCAVLMMRRAGRSRARSR